MSVTAFAADPQCVKPLVGGGYPCLDELGLHKLRGDSTRGGHESHLIPTMYICGGSAGSQWRRHTDGGQQRCSRGYGWACIITPHG